MANKVTLPIKLKTGTEALIKASVNMQVGEVALASDTRRLWEWNGISHSFIGEAYVDVESNLNMASGVKGAIYFATDTRKLFIGDGEWVSLGYVSDAELTTTSGAIIDYVNNNSGMCWELLTGSGVAAHNKGYLLDTTSGVVYLSLPSSPSLGCQVGVKIINSNNSAWLQHNGNPIFGLYEDWELDIPEMGMLFVYSNTGEGWVSVYDNLLTTSGGMYVSNEVLTTVSGDIIDYVNTVSGSLASSSRRSPLLIDVGANLTYTTIQAGIDACDTSAGDYYLVRVMPGIYNEDITLKDNVDLAGVNYSACILNGSVSWPASTCTPDGWSCILDIYISGESTVSGYSLVTIEEGQHDLNNLWLVLTMSGTGGSIVNMSGGHLHGYMPEYQYFSLGDSTEGTKHEIFKITGGIYEEQSGEIVAEIEDSVGEVIGYGVYSTNPDDRVVLINPKVNIIHTSAEYQSISKAFEISSEGTGLIVEAGYVAMTSQAGGTGTAFYLDSSIYGVSTNVLISNANRIEVTGFSFNYTAITNQPSDLWVSHFDTISAQDGYQGDLGTYAVVHSDEYGELHLNKFIRFSPISELGTERELIRVEVGQVANPSLSFNADPLGNKRLIWENPEGNAAFDIEGNGGPAFIGIGAVGALARNYRSTLSLVNTTNENDPNTIRSYSLTVTSGEQDFEIRRIWDNLSYATLLNMDKDGLLKLRYGDSADRILNESDMSSYSPAALPTQKSVVDYVNTVSGTLYDRFSEEYATQSDLVSASGIIMNYITTQGAATVPYVDTVSGSLHTEVVTTSGTITNTIVSMAATNRAYVDAYIKPYHYVSVSVSGGDFNKIQDAVDSITINDFNTDYWVVVVHPGVYYENVYLKDNVNLIGDSFDGCMIEGSVNWLAASGCSIDAWSSLQNITIQGFGNSERQYSLIYSDVGFHDIVNSYVWLQTSGTEGNCILMEGGVINSYLTEYEYESLGIDNENHRIVRGLGGTFESQSDKFILTINCTGSGVVCLITQRGLSDLEYTKVSGLVAQVEIATTYSGTIELFRIRGESHNNSISSSTIQINGHSNCGGYAYYLDSLEVGADHSTLRSNSNRIRFENMTSSYFAHLGLTDFLYTRFDAITAASGVDGSLTNYEMVSSEIDGKLRLTENLVLGKKTPEDQNLVEVDIGEDEYNPKLRYDHDYFGYSTLSWNTSSGSIATVVESTEGSVLVGSMSMGDDAFSYEQRLSAWAHQTNTADPLGYERRGYRLKRKTDDTFAISRHWTYEDGGDFVDLLNIDPWGGIRLRNSDVRVSSILDEDNLISNTTSGLATQRSIKTYVDGKVSTISGVMVDILSNNGFLHSDTASMDFNNTNRTLTISGTYDVVVHHVHYAKDGVDQVQIDDVEGKHYIYYCDGGGLTASISPFSLLSDAPVATVYWDKENQKSILFAYEQHSTDMANATHVYLHNVRGMDWENGLALIHNATASGSPNVDNRNTWIGLTGGKLVDEDIGINITNVSGTSSVMFAQDLGDLQVDAVPLRSSKIPVYYATTYSGNVVWRKADATDFPFLYNGSNYPRVNEYTTEWGLTDVSDGCFVYWVYGCPDIDNPIVAIPHTETYSTIEEARAGATVDKVFLGRENKPTYEMRLLYRLIYECDSSYAEECKHSVLRAVTDYRISESVTIEGTSVSNHSSLPDLGSSGHPASIITVDQSFSNFLTGYTNTQAALQRVDSYVPAIYSTKEELVTTSGVIIGYIDSQNFAQNVYVDQQDLTTSGVLKNYVDSELLTTSGILKGYTDSELSLKSHSTLLDLDLDGHPQYGHLGQNETVSGNWTVDTKLNFNSYSNLSPSDGNKWYESDFKSRSGGQTLVDGMVSLVQLRHTIGITAQDCNGAGAAIEWNAEDVIDGLYGHSTSTNRSRVTVSGTAWYKLTYSVSHLNQDVRRKNIATQVRKNGSDYLSVGKAYSLSYNSTDDYGTNFASSLIRLTSGDYIEVMASGVGSTGTANTDQTGGTYLTLEFIRWGS